MKSLTRVIIVLLLVVVPASTALGDWFDDYDAGIKAAQNQNWDAVVAKMNAAIAKHPHEGNRERTYGNIFIPYHPYYYRGYAYMQKGLPCNSQAALKNLQSAMSDLKNTSGTGSVSFGEPSSLIIRLNEMITACALTVNQTPAKPTKVEPPEVDPNLEPAKRRATASINTAMSKLAEAQGAQAPRLAATEFSRASNLLREANNLNVSASTTADFDKVADAADKATRAFDAAITAARLNVPAPPVRTATETVSPVKPPPPKPVVTPSHGTEVLRVDREQLKQALGAYFDGDFRASASKLEALAREHGNNAMIWAFLGAAEYSDYYVHGGTSETTLQAAKDALRQARHINPKLQLDSKYFSPRVRSFYASLD